MNFVDYTLVRLADPQLRSSIFDQPALQQLLSTAYDTDSITVEGPFRALFDRFSVGLSMQRRTSIEGRWGEVSDPQRQHIVLHFDANDSAATLRVDALWQGSIVANVGSARSRVESVSATWPSMQGIDAEIIAGLGALPASVADLDAERRRLLLTRWRASALQPDALQDSVFDDWVRSVGASSVSELMMLWPGIVAAGTVKVGFSPSVMVPPSTQALPISAAILVRDQPIDLGRMLSDSRQVRETLLVRGAEVPSNFDFASRSQIVVSWIVPSAVFDDADWSGGDVTDSAETKNLKRRTAAQRWLASEGIGLLTMPPHPI